MMQTVRQIKKLLEIHLCSLLLWCNSFCLLFPVNMQHLYHYHFMIVLVSSALIEMCMGKQWERDMREWEREIVSVFIYLVSHGDRSR